MDNECAVCLQRHSQLLMLACSHDPCIQCAATHYTKEVKAQADFQLAKNIDNLYPCSICFQITKIDRSSIEQMKLHVASKVPEKASSKINRRCKSNQQKLQRIRSKLFFDEKGKKSSSKRVKSPQESSTSSSQNFQMLTFVKNQQSTLNEGNEIMKSKSIQKSQTTVFKNPSIHYFQERLDFCSRHTDQLRTYFCFTCSDIICPQCAIHGCHVGHQVEVVRKAGAKLKNLFGKSVLEAQRSEAILGGIVKDFNHLIESYSEWNNRQRKSLQEKFQQLQKLLRQKEQKLLVQINDTEQKGLAKIRQEKEAHEKNLLDLRNKRRKLKEDIYEEVTSWDFQSLKNQKAQILLLSEGIKQNIAKKAEKVEVIYLNCDVVEEAIETIEELVGTFRLTIRNKDLEGTATFKGLL